MNAIVLMDRPGVGQVKQLGMDAAGMSGLHTASEDSAVGNLQQLTSDVEVDHQPLY